MADVLKKMYCNKPGTANATLYTVPANTVAIIKSITFSNVTTTDATIGIYAGGQLLINSYTVPAKATVILNDLGILNAGDTIQGWNGTANAIAVWISGMEVS